MAEICISMHAQNLKNYLNFTELNISFLVLTMEEVTTTLLHYTLLQADKIYDDKVATAVFLCTYVHTCSWLCAPAKMLTQAFWCNFSVTAAKLSHMFIKSREISGSL